jgi:uncharacterized protein (TIGR02996 family)
VAAVTQDDFVNAIAANGDDDVLQLVFSDWLEEHGNSERAELVRIQLELAKVPNEDPRYPKLLNEERALWIRWMRSEISARANASKSPRFTSL